MDGRTAYLQGDDQELQLFCRLILAILKNRKAEFRYKIDNLKNADFIKFV
jgi:hypothetical protein